MSSPLLIACALRVELLALRRARAHASVIRTGMGARAAERALSGPALRGAAVLATGFCGGLNPGMRPGDVVVDSAGALAAAIDRAGFAVHIGRIAQSDHVVRGAERAELRAAGAVAVDMESATVMRVALARGALAAAAVRVVVDSTEYELVRFGTLRTGFTAFRSLSALVPTLLDWHRYNMSPREMK